MDQINKSLSDNIEVSASDLFSYVQRLSPDIDHIKKSQIVDDLKDNQIVGYQYSMYTSAGFPIGGGTHSVSDSAFRICIAETLERGYVRDLFHSHKKVRLKLDVYPSTCGFACGFQNERVRSRAIAEGLERWIWSKWIDDGYEIAEIQRPKHLSPLSVVLLRTFDNARYFEKTFVFNGIHFVIGIVIGLVGKGIFAGSRVCGLNESPWEHAIVEADRNYINFIRAKRDQSNLSNPLQMKICLFGENGELGLNQIRKATKIRWPVVEVDLLEEYQTGYPGIYLWRCLPKDFIYWHLGNIERFVY